VAEPARAVTSTPVVDPGPELVVVGEDDGNWEKLEMIDDDVEMMIELD
jgi:hypothetical protein